MIIEAIQAEAIANHPKRVRLSDAIRALPYLAMVLAYGFIAGALLLL